MNKPKVAPAAAPVAAPAAAPAPAPVPAPAQPTPVNQYSAPGAVPPPPVNQYSAPGAVPPPPVNQYSAPGAVPPPPVNQYSAPGAVPPPPVNQYSAPQPAGGSNADYCNWYISYEDSRQINKFFHVMWICFAASILTCGISAIVGVVFMYILLYKFWKVIPYQENPDVTPGKALGFCFIPFFNLYWIFIAFRRLAIHYSPYASGPVVAYGLLLCILWCCSCIPYVGFLAGIAVSVFLILEFNELRKVTNALGEKNAAYTNTQYNNY